MVMMGGLGSHSSRHAGFQFTYCRNNKAPTYVEALSFKYGTSGRTDWTGIPAATTKITLGQHIYFQTPRTTKGRYKSDLSMYGTGGRT